MDGFLCLLSLHSWLEALVSPGLMSFVSRVVFPLGPWKQLMEYGRRCLPTLHGVPIPSPRFRQTHGPEKNAPKARTQSDQNLDSLETDSGFDTFPPKGPMSNGQYFCRLWGPYRLFELHRIWVDSDRWIVDNCFFERTWEAWVILSREIWVGLPCPQTLPAMQNGDTKAMQ